MRICKHCGKEINDEDIFCPHCGAEIDSDKKKLNFLERREEREREKQFILSKASLQSDDVKQAPLWNIDDLFIQKKVEAKKAKSTAIVRIIIELIVAIACIVLDEIIARGTEELNSNIKLLVIFATFIIIAICVAFFISDLHYLQTLNKMAKSNVAIKKMKYGEDPTMYHDGVLYELSTKASCPNCRSENHIEEFEGGLYVVCNTNRTHLYKIDTIKLCEDFITRVDGSKHKEEGV